MKAAPTDPIELARANVPGSVQAEPGLVLVFAAGRPHCLPLPLGPAPLEIGRGQGALTEHADTLMSRRHAIVCYRDARFEVTDLGSRNGSAIEGTPLRGTTQVAGDTLVRFGGSLFLCCHDLRPFRQLGVRKVSHQIQGPLLQSALLTVYSIAESSRVLFISGGSGAGKESFAQAFHSASPQGAGPFVAVNCAAIPAGIAERLLFGARTGAYSGVTKDSEGYIEAANGGTLFLDEVADLDMVVQGKLLRVIESGELLRLGETSPRKVRFRVCSATHRDLRSLANDGKFRADLYFRIGVPEVSVPSLRERREEIPWLLDDIAERTASGLRIDVSLVESCMLRVWPGNIRELLAEASAAVLKARAAGVPVVTAEHLNPSAGAKMKPSLADAQPLRSLDAMAASEGPALASGSGGGAASPRLAPPSEPPSKSQVVAALLEAGGNVSAAARALRIHRTQLRRLLIRYKIDVEALRDMGRLPADKGR